MGTVVMHAVVSVDGLIADEHDDVGPLFDWYRLLGSHRPGTARHPARAVA